MKCMGRVGLEVPKGGRYINRGKMISIITEWIDTRRHNEVPVGLTVTIMAFTKTGRTNNVVAMITKTDYGYLKQLIL